MKLNVNFEIYDLKDKSLDEKAGSFIADMLLNHKGDSLKLYELAMKLNKEDLIDVDTTDLKLIETAIRENQRYNNLIKGAILKEIECQKTLSNTEKKDIDKPKK